MKNPELSRIIKMLENTYNGAAWHGSTIMELLNSINAEIAFKPAEHIHKICELVQHITAWRIFAIKRIEGDKFYEVSQKENWKTFEIHDDASWEEIKTDLAESQQALVHVLHSVKDELLDEEVNGKAYDYYTLIHGVIQHDLYHLGEIALLAREQKLGNTNRSHH